MTDITETITGNGWQWAVTLTGAPLDVLRKRAEAIRAETTDIMTAYYVKQIGGVEVQMEFTNMEDAA